MRMRDEEIIRKHKENMISTNLLPLLTTWHLLYLSFTPVWADSSILFTVYPIKGHGRSWSLSQLSHGGHISLHLINGDSAEHKAFSDTLLKLKSFNNDKWVISILFCPLIKVLYRFSWWQLQKA